MLIYVWHLTRLSQWALLIKRWRHCSFSTALGNTQVSPCSTLEDQLWWSYVCIRQASVMEQTTSNNLVIWPLKAQLLMDCFFPFPVISNADADELGLHVTVPKKLPLYYYYYWLLTRPWLSINKPGTRPKKNWLQVVKWHALICTLLSGAYIHCESKKQYTLLMPTHAVAYVLTNSQLKPSVRKWC